MIQKQPRFFGMLRRNRLLLGDLFVALVVAALAVGLLAAAPAFLSGAGGGDAILLENNREILRLRSAELAAGGSREIEVNGYHYRLEFESGRIRFASANCPDRVCVQTGWISHAGQIAACVPGRLILKMEGRNSAVSGSEPDIQLR